LITNQRPEGCSLAYQRDQVTHAIDAGGIAAGRSELLWLDLQRRIHNRTMALRRSEREKHNAETEDELEFDDTFFGEDGPQWILDFLDHIPGHYDGPE